MKTKAILLLIPVFFLVSTLATAQDKIDSLALVINTSENDSVAFDAIIKQATLYYHADSTELVLSKLKEAEKYLTTSDEKEQIYRYQKISNFYKALEKYEIVISYYKKIANLIRKQGDDHQYIAYMNTAAYLHTFACNYDKSAEILLDNLRYAEAKELTDEIPQIYMYLGFAMRNSDRAMAEKYFRLCIEMETDTSTAHYFTSLHEMGNLYNQSGQVEKAIPYYTRAMRIRELLNDVTIVYSYHDIALAYKKIGKYEDALKYLKKCVEIEERKGDRFELSISYTSIADLLIKMKQYDKADQYLQKAMVLAEQLDLNSIYEVIYSKLYELHKSRNNYKEALENLEITMAYSNEINREETNKAVAELDKKYQTEKKEAEIKILQKQKEADKAIIQKQRIAGIAIVVVLLLIVLLSIVLFRSREKQKKANKLLAEKNAEINLQNEEIQTQAEYLADANKAISKQKEELEVSHKKIKDSITYASRIQRALLPSKKNLDEVFPAHFIFYKPRDVVSGDFYYCKKMNQYHILAAADCTGHGVPGAFVSMLGIAFLNEIVRKKTINTPAKILDDLREHVKTSLKQTGNDSSETKDGMDIALLVINTKNHVLEFAGANNPLFIIRNNELIEMKGTKNPIGIYIKERPFENQQIQLQDNDRIYLFSDGYIDQFGGENGKKLMKKNFKDLLLTIHKETPDKQKEQLDKTMQTWIRNYEQNDDMMIIGVEYHIEK